MSVTAHTSCARASMCTLVCIKVLMCFHPVNVLRCQGHIDLSILLYMDLFCTMNMILTVFVSGCTHFRWAIVAYAHNESVFDSALYSVCLCTACCLFQ